MTRKQICIALLLVMALDGAVSGAADATPPFGWMLATSFATSLLCFAWYRKDRDERSYRARAGSTWG